MRYALAGIIFMVTTIMPSWAAEKLPPVHSEEWSSKYDKHFRKYTKRYFGPHFNWHWFKAQGIAESRLKKSARSKSGAIGIMQLMPATFEEIRSDNLHFSDLESPRWNIAAGIFYDRQLFRKWRKIPEQERLYLTLASYNAGYSRILRASKKAKQPVDSWSEVKPHAPGQTRHYVKKIQGLMEEQERPHKRLRGIAKLLQN